MTIADSGCLMENGGSCLPCTPDEEKKIVKDLMDEAELDLKEGNFYYIVSTRYFFFCPISLHSPDFLVKSYRGFDFHYI